MRLPRVTALIAALAAGSPLAAQTSFEGVIVFQTTASETDKAAHTMIQTTKGKMMRIDMPGVDGDHSVSMILNMKARTITTIMGSQKKYMVMPMKNLDDAMMSSRDGHTTDLPQIVKTGRSETVAGVRCDIYKGTKTTSKGTEDGEACMAKGVGFAMFDAFMNSARSSRSGNANYDMFRQMREQDLRMLKAWRTVNGKTEAVIEATKIERKSVSDAAFTVPAGYAEIHMPNMGNH